MSTATGKRGRVVEAPPRGVAGIVTEIRAEIAACRLCAAMKPFRKRPPESFGTTKTGYLFVGEAPGRDGPVFAEALAEVGDERFRELSDLFFLSDAVRCRPRHKTQKGKTRTPSPAECRTCNPYLQLEIRALRPRLVVAAGTKAAQAVLGLPLRIEDVHGRRQRVRDVEVLPLLLPSHHVALRRAGMTAESYRRWLIGLFGALIDQLD